MQREGDIFMYDQERRYFFENIFFVVIQFLIVFIIVAKQMEYNSDYLVHAQIAAGVSKNDILHFGRFFTRTWLSYVAVFDEDLVGDFKSSTKICCSICNSIV